MKQAVRNNKDENDDPKELGEEGHYILRRYSIVVLLLGVLIVGISVFVFKIAFSEKERWVKVAATRQRPNQLVMPTRGNIYSADGKLMATSVPRYYMYIDFQADGFRRDSFLHSKTYGVDSLAFYLSKILKNRTPRDYRNHLMKGLRLRSREYPVYEGRVSFSELMEIKRIPYIKRSRNISGFYEKAIIKDKNFMDL
jgi:cell division protein FtsI (penicillin-binding protein 3)